MFGHSRSLLYEVGTRVVALRGEVGISASDAAMSS